MIEKRRWAVLDVLSDPLKSGLAADFTLVDGILDRLNKHPDRNPLTNPTIRSMADTAIAAWGNDESIGTDFESYMYHLYPLHPRIADRLLKSGYISDIDIAVETDSPDDPPQLLSDSSI